MSTATNGKNKGVRPGSMVVASAGLCCSLGYHLDAAVCAMRANMDHFRESGFFNGASDPIRAASLPDDIFGQDRLQLWIEYAIRDCARHLHEPHSLLDSARTALIVLAPESGRPHASQTDYADMAQAAMSALRAECLPAGGVDAPAVTLIAQGRSGLTATLLLAARYLAAAEAEQVLLIGVDSYLNAADINDYLAEGRLLVPGNSNGFLPGEAAAALLLRPALSESTGLHVKGAAMADEAGRQDGSVPSRAQGLTQAVRSACEQAGVLPSALSFRLGDQNGEQFYAREAADAFTRVMFGEHELTLLTLADKIGEVGAATGPAMLAWMWREMAHPTLSPGNVGVVHLANDDGQRSAVVLQYYGE
ncbi:hypothetical protein LXA47_05210 [Massilia sp. P8910]|uniref:hypothetical protein n=1 Tax=Massilia antarctica TaxID=2765360 RepID=UPI001E4C516F|nr:hypothetical protein [Massilia antarctica]MCE3603001.1 hypothetical protein [Massilia antarctica]